MAKSKSTRNKTTLSVAKIDRSPTDGPSQMAESEIAQRAYYLYLARGRADGHDINDWLEAEREARQGAAPRLDTDKRVDKAS